MKLFNAIAAAVALGTTTFTVNTAYAFDLVDLINNVSRNAQRERELKIQNAQRERELKIQAEREEARARAAEAQALEASTEQRINAEVERRLAIERKKTEAAADSSEKTSERNDGFMSKETNALAAKLTKEEQNNIKTVWNECKLRGFPESNMWNRCLRPLYYSKGLTLPRDPMAAVMYVKFSEANENPMGALLQLGGGAGY